MMTVNKNDRDWLMQLASAVADIAAKTAAKSVDSGLLFTRLPVSSAGPEVWARLSMITSVEGTSVTNETSILHLSDGQVIHMEVPPEEFLDRVIARFAEINE